MTTDSIDVLIVTASGQHFGVPVEQIERLAPLTQDAASRLTLAEALGLAPTAAESHLLLARGGSSFRVDGVGDLTSLPLASLRRLPAMLGRSRSVVGAAVLADRPPLLLLDLDKLKGEPAC